MLQGLCAVQISGSGFGSFDLLGAFCLSIGLSISGVEFSTGLTLALFHDLMHAALRQADLLHSQLQALILVWTLAAQCIYAGHMLRFIVAVFS